MSEERITKLEERVRKLAMDKSYLQLVIHMMQKLSAAPGLENTIEVMLRHVMDVIGGSNIIVYYFIDSAIHYADAFGMRKTLDAVDDVHVKKVLQTREFIAYEHDFSDTMMKTPEFSKAWTWIVPLKVGDEMVGVFKMESLSIGTREMEPYLPAFFSYAALLLKNEILGHTRLKQAYDRLNETNAELTSEIIEKKRVENELLSARDELEKRVIERTTELRSANERLHDELAERKRAEDALNKTMREVHDLYNHAPCGYHSLNADGIFVRINDTELEWLGYKREEVLGKLAFPDVITPSSLDLFRRSFPVFVERGWINDLEFELKRKDGSVMNVLLSATAIKDADGKFVMSRSTVYDITPRKQAEIALRRSEEFVKNILETVDNGFIVVDRSFRIISANRAYLETVGKSLEDVIGKRCHEISHRSDTPCSETGCDCPVMKTFATGEPHSSLHVHLDSEGTQLFVETKSFPVKDETGAVVSAIEVIADITEKKRLEDQLLHAQKMEAVGRLAGGIAHDFNNILNVVIGYGNLMEMTIPEGDPSLPYLREIISAAEKAANLTQGLLIFSRKQVTDLKPISVNDLVSGMRKMLFRIIGEDIETVINTADNPLTVMADFGQMEQVLMNFATNARDAMPSGGALTIETSSVEMDSEFIHSHGYGKPGQYALISVSDTGTGMDEKTTCRIFEPFFTTKDIGKGTGLGLSIVYGIVKQHRGYINCYSEPGIGTTFKVYLPLIDEKYRDERHVEKSPITGGNETILLAEDNAALRTLTKELLERYGYTVIEAQDGVEAVARFMEHGDRIRLMLLDVIMPRKSGKDAYDEIHAIRPDMKSLFISGYPDNIVQREEITGANLEIIQKPVSNRDLLRKIREQLDRGRQM
ncbi:MAG: PAS domain S-box protein [Nitrospirae bacterium]|nr:PAS domain S-box protein [Nitrospirota bacterium]